MIRLYVALALIVSIGLNWWQFQHCNSAMARIHAEHEAKQATAAAQAIEQARKAEAEKADLANQVAIEYERGKQDAQAVADRVADDLRAGALRLRKQWQGCEARVSQAAPGTREPDAGAADRAEGARRIVRAAAECDAQVKGLQALVKADRS